MTLAHNVIGTLAGRQAGAGGEAQSINIHDYGSDGKKSLSCGSLSLFSPSSLLTFHPRSSPAEAGSRAALLSADRPSRRICSAFPSHM